MEMLEQKTFFQNFFKGLEFEEQSHRYSLGSKPLSLSVSGIVKKFVNPFDTAGKSLKKALEEGLTQAEILDRWEKKKNTACDFGTSVHLFGENYTFNRELKPSNGHEKAIVKFFNKLPKHVVPVMTELQMYHKDYLFAGTCDTLLFNKESGNYLLTDWKGLPLDTPIFTDKGWKTMETLMLSDKVYDKDGNLCKIKHISNVHNKKCLKIKFNNGEEVVSDFEHRWEVTRATKKWSKNYIMTTEEIKNYIDEKKEKNKYIQGINILKIKNPKPLNNKRVELPIDPYVLGVWLGDGHKIDGKITQANKKVWEEIEKRGYSLGKDLSQGGSGKAQTRTVFGLETQLRILKLKNNKHIPDIFLQSSYEQRIDLLRGFMDADGYYNSCRNRFVLTTTRPKQVEFSVQLLGSLGIKPTVLPKIARCSNCNKKEFQSWDITFFSYFNPFLSRNQEIVFLEKKQNNQDYRNIISVKEVETVPTKCIEVESPSHTYLFGYSFITTHNTNENLHKNFGGQKLLGCFSDLLENNFNKYQIQLSLYQILFEQTGYKIEERRVIHLLPDGEFYAYKAEDYTDRLKNYLEKNKL